MFQQGVRSYASQLLLGARSVLFVTPWLGHLLLADIVLSALLPVSTLFPNLCYNASSYVAESVWRVVQLIFTRINRANIIVSGAEKLPKNESAIVVANHIEWTDFYMIQELAIRSGMLARCRWFAKHELKWVPFLGWGLWAMGMPLVSRKWTNDQREMNRVFQGVVQRRWPMWLISYSEGTRYTTSGRIEAEAWCKSNAKPLPKNLLYPRTRGFIATCQQLRNAPHVKAVYDITVAYAKKNGDAVEFQRAPTFAQSLLWPRLDRDWRFFVHVERYPMEDLPSSSEELAQWLEDRWMEKGERLETLRQRMQKGLPWDPL